MVRHRKWARGIAFAFVSICACMLLLTIAARNILHQYFVKLEDHEYAFNLPFEPCTPYPTPACTPDTGGSRIAFSSNRACSNWLTQELATSPYAIYVMNADGTCPTRLTHTLINALNPQWSPDGAHILFESDMKLGVIGDVDSDSYALYVMDADGSRVKRLADYGRCYPRALWSPDGSRIAFLSGNEIRNCTLYTMGADGSHRSPLVGVPIDSAWDHFGWSPDGKQVTFSATDPETGQSEVYIVNADGSGLTNLTVHPANDDFVAWTPDGCRLLFLSDRDEKAGRGRTLYIMDADGSDAQRLIDDVTFCGGSNIRGSNRGVWLPSSSSKIVLEQGSHWYVVDVDCVLSRSTISGDLLPECRVQLPKDPSLACFVNWPPGGKQFSYEGVDTMTTRMDIIVVNFDGTGLRNLTNCPADDISPAWSP